MKEQLLKKEKNIYLRLAYVFIMYYQTSGIEILF